MGRRLGTTVAYTLYRCELWDVPRYHLLLYTRGSGLLVCTPAILAMLCITTNSKEGIVGVYKPFVRTLDVYVLRNK
jgi:hypothetical protein